MIPTANKNKPDPKLRFQNRDFKQQLNQARNYRRPVIAKDTGIFSIKTILLNPWAYIGLALTGFLVYFLFFPNYFTIRQIDINGLKPADKNNLKEEIISRTKNNKFTLRKDNLLLFPKEKTISFLESNDINVLKVSSIKKVFPDTLIINIVPRVNCFFISRQESDLVISCDGVITEKTAHQEQSSHPSLIPIDLEIASTEVGKKVIEPQIIAFLDNLKTTQIPLPDTKISLVKIRSEFNKEASVKTASGEEIYLDTSQNLAGSLQKLKLIFGDLPENQKTALAYVDLRLPDKAYVCIKGSPCASLQAQTAQATSTATSTTNTIK